MIPAPQKLIVIDTNVCLDLFVFHDPRWAPLLAALEAAKCEAVTRADCRDEYRIVLHYPHLPLDEERPPAPPKRFDALIAWWRPTAAPCACRSAPTATTRNSSKSRAMPAPPS
jgi:hypothetical protein